MAYSSSMSSGQHMIIDRDSSLFIFFLYFLLQGAHDHGTNDSLIRLNLKTDNISSKLWSYTANAQ